MLKKYQDHIPFSFAYKLVCVDDRFNKPIDVFRGKNAAFKFIEAILKDHEYCKKVMKKHFNKNFIMNKEEEQFSQVTRVGFVKNSLTMTTKKLEIIVT